MKESHESFSSYSVHAEYFNDCLNDKSDDSPIANVFDIVSNAFVVSNNNIEQPIYDEYEDDS
jgi:hypothetical protein